MRLFLKFYKGLSVDNRRRICFFFKKTPFIKGDFYKNLKFNGSFRVKMGHKKKFSMVHYGGDIENETFWKGAFNTWERDSGWIWMELSPVCDIIFDIGANTGIYSLVAKSLNPNAKVFAFEPSLQTHKKLKKNIELNNFNIQAEELAVSNKTGLQVFYDLPYQNQTGASLSPEKMKNWKGYNGGIIEYNVKTVTLADYIRNNNISKIDLIKLDIEMHEPEALEGMGEYLNKFRPIIIFEVLSDEVARKMMALINLNNFVLFHLKNDGKAEELSKFQVYPGSLSKGDWNYIIFHKSLIPKIQKFTTLYN